MFLNEGDLGEGEGYGAAHHAEYFEIYPEIGGEVAPDHLIQHREKQKEDAPA